LPNDSAYNENIKGNQGDSGGESEVMILTKLLLEPEPLSHLPNSSGRCNLRQANGQYLSYLCEKERQQ